MAIAPAYSGAVTGLAFFFVATSGIVNPILTKWIVQVNILQASMLAMTRAVKGLNIQPDWVWVDGNHYPKGLPAARYAGQAMIKGDAKEACISAASILAKVARDADCLRLHALYPEYGFDQHKGYPTAAHLLALQRHGVTPEHRMSFAPVRTLQFKSK